MRRLHKNVGHRAIHTRWYEKRVLGHHIQMDVKFLTLKAADGTRVRRYPYTAIDDSTQLRPLRIYSHHKREDTI